MGEPSNFVYTASVHNGRKYVQGIIPFAMTQGQNVAQGWESNKFKNVNDFKFLAERAAGSRLITVAILMSQTIEYFPIKQDLDKFSIYAFQKMEAPGVYIGDPVAFVLSNISVLDTKPIFQWKGLPGVRPPQMAEIDRLHLRVGAFAVTFFLPTGNNIDIYKNGSLVN